jgi:hypothetical protein
LIADRVWDCGPAHSAGQDFPDAPIPVLEGPDDAQLCVIERPRYPRQYLVAPLEPEGFKPHHFRMVDEPNGIAVPNDPVRAAAAVSRRVLPRYRQAMDAVRHNALIQPEPPHRLPAPEVAQTLTLIWYPTGSWVHRISRYRKTPAWCCTAVVSSTARTRLRSCCPPHTAPATVPC